MRPVLGSARGHVARARLRPIGAAIVTAMVASASAHADPAAATAATVTTASTASTAPGADRPSEAPLPSCLDQSIRDELGRELRPRGVQKRDFQKDGRLQVIARGGLYAGDLTSSSWLAGGALALWFTEDFGIEAGFDVTPIALDLDDPLADFFGDDRFEKGLGFLPLANLLWSPIHTKLRIGDDIVHGDFLFYAGGGRLIHDSVQGVTFDAGFALDLFTSNLVTVRFDVRDVMAVQEAVAETRFTNNLVATMALTLWLPTPL